MIETQELEKIVIDIRNETCRISEHIMDEIFAENIERRLYQLPPECREMFMRIARDYGYKTPTERAFPASPESEAFDDDIYDLIFPHGR